MSHLREVKCGYRGGEEGWVCCIGDCCRKGGWAPRDAGQRELVNDLTLDGGSFEQLVIEDALKTLKE